jgi:hypothetical protein
VEGRRVKNGVGGLERPGDYCPCYNDAGQITHLWLALPGWGQWTRLPSTHSPVEGEPRWTITEDADGRVTVDPSIKVWWNQGPEQREIGWHGYLKAGEWETLDDSTPLPGGES